MKPTDLLPFLTLNRSTTRYDIPLIPEGTTIPRIIHQTYFTRDLPQDLADSIQAFRARNPGWDYRFYDNGQAQAFIEQNYGPEILRHYLKINPEYGAARADLFRYLLMYKTGGAYFDIKSAITPPLDDILRPDDRLILAQWSKTPEFEGAGINEWGLGGKIEGGELQQWHIICAPGHPYLRQVIQNVLRNIDVFVPRLHPHGGSGVLNLTGPVAYTLAILPLMPQGRHRFVPDHLDLGLVYSIYAQKGHLGLFTRHYRQLSTPIVHASPTRRAIARLYDCIETLRNRPKP
jgi:hypothetical protein